MTETQILNCFNFYLIFSTDSDISNQSADYYLEKLEKMIGDVKPSEDVCDYYFKWSARWHTDNDKVKSIINFLNEVHPLFIEKHDYLSDDFGLSDIELNKFVKISKKYFIFNNDEYYSHIHEVLRGVGTTLISKNERYFKLKRLLK